MSIEGAGFRQHGCCGLITSAVVEDLVDDIGAGAAGAGRHGGLRRSTEDATRFVKRVTGEALPLPNPASKPPGVTDVKMVAKLAQAHVEEPATDDHARARPPKTLSRISLRLEEQEDRSCEMVECTPWLFATAGLGAVLGHDIGDATYCPWTGVPIEWRC